MTAVGHESEEKNVLGSTESVSSSSNGDLSPAPLSLLAIRCNRMRCNKTRRNHPRFGGILIGSDGTMTRAAFDGVDLLRGSGVR